MEQSGGGEDGSDDGPARTQRSGGGLSLLRGSDGVGATTRALVLAADDGVPELALRGGGHGGVGPAGGDRGEGRGPREGGGQRGQNEEHGEDREKEGGGGDAERGLELWHGAEGRKAGRVERSDREGTGG